ncbi:hypothetical protein GKZ68_20445 (plasmid) [Hymenobacter sp. BRD128]|uniref:hypothetical protein n=1 Tax=Hymenobacter sp. BRD128 TaxID=2675878 RepID=UPI001567607E|nr:hypothetical protein [Hymenobacter sp. BRD128]QKG59054.1 hypothetical protein GKZ68_20445 [Hymenobacter sp. BRD128]
MASGPLLLLVGVLLLLAAGGFWVIRLHQEQAELPLPVGLPVGQNHHTVGEFHYVLSDYLDQKKQLRDKQHAEEHALRIERLRHHEQFTQHQTELAAEQARDQAAWEDNKEAIAQWLAQQQQADAALNPAPPSPPAPPDFQEGSLTPARRRKAIFQQLTAAPEALAA